MLATHTDGVGSKIIIANMLKKYDTIGIDCIAMNVNDIICVGATPISFVDYIAANKNDQRIFKQIVKGLVYGAKIAQVPIIGGETAIMPDLFSGNKFAMDLAGTVVGITSRRKMVFGKSIKSGDVIEVRQKSRKMDIILESMRRIKGDMDLSWLSLDKAKMKGTFNACLLYTSPSPRDS